MATLAAFLPTEDGNGTRYAFTNAMVAFAIVQDLHRRIHAIQRAGTLQANTYFARCYGDSSVLTNVPRSVVNSAVMHFIRVGRFLDEQIQSAEELTQEEKAMNA